MDRAKIHTTIPSINTIGALKQTTTAPIKMARILKIIIASITMARIFQQIIIASIQTAGTQNTS
jgi:hypothetical protein